MDEDIFLRCKEDSSRSGLGFSRMELSTFATTVPVVMKVLNWILCGRRLRGRLKLQWKDCVAGVMMTTDVKANECHKRVQWKLGAGKWDQL